MPNNKTFGYMFAAVFGLLSIYCFRKGLMLGFYGAIVLCVGLIFLATFFSSVLNPFNVIWFKFGQLLHKIVSPFVMLALFVTTIVPGGVFVKLARRDPLRFHFAQSQESYWEERPDDEVSLERMKQQF